MNSSFNNLAKLWACLSIAVMAAACTSPGERIQDNPEAFSKLPPQQQELIKQGRVGLGFDETAVKLALGDPDRITQRTDEKGVSTVWRYVEYDTDAGVPLYTGFYHRYYAPYYGAGFGYPYFADYPNRTERDVQRVIFNNGRVTAVEQELR